MQPAAQVDELRTGGSAVEATLPDADSLDAVGTDLMDPWTRQFAARAGHALGRGRAEQLTQLWH